MKPQTSVRPIAVLFFVLLGSVSAAEKEEESILAELPTASLLSTSTVPSNGDLNPYGVAFVPRRFPSGGTINPGDVLVANFNNSANSQGTGTTIVRITPAGGQSLFFAGPSGLGLDTALGVLKRGFVVVGNVPTTDGTCSTIEQGSLLVLNRQGEQVANLADQSLLNGPWDLTVHEHGSHVQVFVSNVLSGTVSRLDIKISEGKFLVKRMTQIASGYMHRCDPAALVVGPTGLAFDARTETLYVASTADNAVYAVREADSTTEDQGKGDLIYSDMEHLRGPLGLVLAPNGNLIAANGDAVNPDTNHPSELIEFTRSGSFVAALSVDTAGQGGAFGIAARGSDDAFHIAAVDDVNNTLKVWTVQ
jgi:DNA-binding beta-propeller fold protein YncE